MKYNKYLLSLSSMLIILGSLFIGANFLFTTPSSQIEGLPSVPPEAWPKLIITNVITKQVPKSIYDQQNRLNSFKVPANTIFSLNIQLDLTFYYPTILTGFFLYQCGFTGRFNQSTNWKFTVQMWNCPVPGTQTYKPGTYHFSLQEDIVPKNVDLNISYPVSLPLQVISTFSKKIHYNSQIYNLTLNNNESLNIQNIQLSNITNSNNQIAYNLHAYVNYYTAQSFNLSNSGCSSLFQLKLIAPNSWNITNVHCYHLFAPSNNTIVYNGTTQYSLYYSLLFPDGQIWSSNTTLPNEFSFKVYFPQHHLLSDIYTLVLS